MNTIKEKLDLMLAAGLFISFSDTNVYFPKEADAFMSDAEIKEAEKYIIEHYLNENVQVAHPEAVLETENGHSYFKITGEIASEMFDNPSPICDCCNKPFFYSQEAFLIPVLGYLDCVDCFNEWAKNATYFEEDRRLEVSTTETYKQKILERQKN